MTRDRFMARRPPPPRWPPPLIYFEHPAARHEGCHAAAALCLGVDVRRMVLDPADDVMASSGYCAFAAMPPAVVIAAPILALGEEPGAIADDLRRLDELYEAAGEPEGWWSAVARQTQRLIERRSFRILTYRITKAVTERMTLDSDELAALGADIVDVAELASVATPG